jgi:hypothetical protein
MIAAIAGPMPGVAAISSSPAFFYRSDRAKCAQKSAFSARSNARYIIQCGRYSLFFSKSLIVTVCKSVRLVPKYL